MIVAKPVIKDKYWILRQADKKVGLVEAGVDGYRVKIGNRAAWVKNINDALDTNTEIVFQPSPQDRSPDPFKVHGYSVTRMAYNPVWDVSRGLPLYTREAASRSWYAAGWYRINRGSRWVVVQDPKLITLSRYPYRGPFRERAEALCGDQVNG